MSTELFRLAAELCRPLGTPKPEPVTPAMRAKTKAREIIDANPGATLTELVALAWLEGRINLVQEIYPERRAHEYDRICGRCGKRDGSVMLAEPPAEGFVQSVCFDCSADDEPRAA
jgi:hypothetical protein